MKRKKKRSARSAVWGHPPRYAETLFESLTQFNVPYTLNKGDVPVRVWGRGWMGRNERACGRVRVFGQGRVERNGEGEV